MQGERKWTRKTAAVILCFFSLHAPKNTALDKEVILSAEDVFDAQVQGT